ncbi:rab-like protein 2B isoform X6 [Piliocolobus tephrosceles]|uniref:rab-like protein 2B isoform X6 n=1 Tax=Piliocolobus tephrosceles TaxID=591936 RepID=UPI000C2A76B5|nr:rab-like protein 2B isoform X6 [Piliocolobus tephrosceles]XP_023077953.1 rab-like protein 2B isoform X6 [Piliocolobus tephrosceles]
MAEDRTKPTELDQGKYDADDNVKIICLGDSAVGKSKLMERFLMDGFQPQQLSTYALTLYKHTTTVDGKTILVADINATQKSFHFAKKFSLPLYFVSAADGTNVVKVWSTAEVASKLFNDAIRLAVSYKQNSQDFMDEIFQELENFKLEQEEENVPDQEQNSSMETPSEAAASPHS